MVKYARRKRTPTIAVVMSREHAANFRSVTVFDLTRNRSEVIIPLEADSKLLTGEYYYEDRQVFFSADTAQRKIYLMHNPELKVYAYNFIDGRATLASTFPLAPDYFARRFQVKFDQGRFDNQKYSLVNASHHTFRVKGDSCLVGYFSGLPEEDYNPSVSAEILNERFTTKSRQYLGLYVKGKKVASDFQVPAYIGKLAHWWPGGPLYFQTESSVRENETSTTFYAFRLVMR